jgi:non-specific protein-tyrosine kinase
MDLCQRFDLVLIDTPPLLAVSDAMPLVAKVDGTLLVSRVGTTTDESAENVVNLVGGVPGARVLGVVANDVPLASLRTHYGRREYASTGLSRRGTGYVVKPGRARRWRAPRGTHSA